MEYKIFNIIRNKIRIPYIVRLIIGVILISTGALLGLIPSVPGFLLGIPGLLLLIPGKSVKYVIKLRKSFSHLIYNINKKKVVKYKFFDIISHIKKLITKS